jgi:hypothetical protein
VIIHHGRDRLPASAGSAAEDALRVSESAAEDTLRASESAAEDALRASESAAC